MCTLDNQIKRSWLRISHSKVFSSCLVKIHETLCYDRNLTGFLLMCSSFRHCNPRCALCRLSCKNQKLFCEINSFDFNISTLSLLKMLKFLLSDFMQITFTNFFAKFVQSVFLCHRLVKIKTENMRNSLF